MSVYNALMLEQDFGSQHVKSVLEVTTDFLDMKTGRFDARFESATDKFNKTGRTNNYDGTKKDYGTVRPTDMSSADSVSQEEDTSEKEEAFQAEQDALDSESDNIITEEFERVAGGKIRIPPEDSPMRAEYDALSAQAKKEFFTDNQAAQSIDEVAQNFINAGREVDVFEEIRRIERAKFKSGKYKTKYSVDESESDKSDEIQELLDFVKNLGWAADFPNVTSLSSIDSLRDHKDYAAAKAGNVEAAFNIVYDLFTAPEVPENATAEQKAKIKRRIAQVKARIEKIKEIKRKHPNAILVSVHALEADGKNQIPKQLAIFIGDYLDFEVNNSIGQRNSVKRTGKDKNYRMQKENQPVFDGAVEAGKEYILIDDAVTMGATFGSLNKYIRQNGGTVVDTIAIGTAQFSSNLALNSKTLYTLLTTYNLQDILQVMQEAGLYEKATTTTEITDVNGQRIQGIDRGRQEISGIRAQENRGNEEKGNQSFRLKNEAGLYEEKESSASRRQGADANAAGNSRTQGGFEEISRIRGQEIQGAGNQTDNVDDFQAISFLTESQAREVIKILKNKNLQPTALSALTQLQNSQPNNQNNQYPADSGKGKIKFSDDTSMGNPVDVSSFDAEAKEAVDKALKALSLQIFGDENVITYKNFVDKRGRVIGGFNFKEMIAIAQGKSIPESKFKYFHEAFHRAFNTFLTKEERKQLIDAFIEHSGGIEKLQSDIAKKKKNYSQEDFDVIIEELMADSFAGFSKNYEGFTGKIKLLFEKLLNRIKAFVGNEDKINNFFNNLLSGEFRNQQSVNNSQKTKFQILGEKGAKALDNLDEATYRMDDLQVARDMEKAGKSVNLIRLATGWEKGGDGKWRYEIEDFVFNDEIFLRIKKGELKTARLYELVSDRKQIKQIIRLHNQYGSFPLIKFIDLADGYRGSFLQTQGTITISTNQTVKEMQNTLVHEVQHWLQYHEGFADGSNANNTDTFDEYFKDAGEVEARNASKRIGMNMMQRLATTLAETEDVAEKDKIYLQKSVDNARAFYSVDPLTAGGISERHGNGLTQEQYQQAQKAANAVFKQKMVKFRRNELNYHDNIEVGVMPLFYQEFGLQGLITIQAKKMADIRDKHPDAWAVIDNAMNYIEKPLAVFKSQKAGDSKSVIVLTDINTKTIKDDPAFDGFIFRPQANNTILVSCYSFSQADIERHIAGLKAVDKKRAAELSGLRSTQRALTMPILDNSSGKIDIADLQNNVNNFRASVDEVDDAVDFHTGKPYNPAEPAKSLKDRDIVQEINSDKESFNAAAALMVGADLGLRARTFAGINGRIKAMLEDKTFYIQPDGNAVITGEGLQPILKEAIETLSKKRSKDYNPADYTYGGYNNKAGGNLADEILKDLSDYLIAKRIGDVEKGYTDFYVNDSHKQKFKHDFGRLFDKYGSFDDLEAFAQRIYDFQKRTLELLVHYGVWSKKHFDAVMKRNPHYIPFYRTLDEGGIDDDIFTEKQKRKMFTPVPMGEPQRSATAKIKSEKFNEAPDPIKDIKGGDLDFQDVFSSIIYNTSRIMNSVYRNEIAAGVAKLQDIFPDMIRNFENPKYKDDRIYNLIEYFEKGKKKYVEVTDGLLLAMNGFDSTQTHWLIRFLALPARMLRKGATTLNLAFMPKNIIRDNFEAFLQTNFENENVIKNSQNEIPTIKIKSKVPKFEKVEHLRQWIFDNILPYIKKIVISDNGDIVSVSRDKVRKDLKRKDDIHNQVYSEFKKLFESAKFIRTEPPKAGHNVKGQKVYIINMELNGQSYEVEFRADVPLSEAEAGSLYFAGHKVKALDKGQDFGSEASSSSSQGLDNTLPQKNGSVKKKSPSFIPIYDSVRVLASMIKRDDLYYSFLRSGAAFGSYMELTEKAITEEAEELIKKAYGKNINLNPLRAIETVGEFGEQATRVAVFKRAKEHGMSDIEAALQAREATLDFGRMGEQVKAANQIIPFLNAGIQAADKFLRTFKQHPEMMLIKGLATITLPSLIMSAYYLFFAPDDERNEYLEIPDYQKAQFWHFKAFGQWWKLPKPFTAGRLFGGLPEQFVNFVYRKDSRAAQEIITKGLFELAQSIIPVDDYGASLMPPLIKVAVENITNYNFFMRRNIYPSYLEGYDNFMKYGKNTGEFLKLLGETLDISPALMESAVRGIGGSGAKDINKFLDFVVERFKGMPVMKSELADTLAVNAFAARTPIGYYSNSVQEFFRNYKEAQRKHNTYNKLDSEDDADKTDNYYDKNYKLLDAYEEIKEYYDEIRDITDEIEDVRKDKRLDKNKRFDKIQKLEREMTEVARQANKETEYIFN
ncbi:MAG: hypothetical protein LBL00_04555 [Endomicrobium sp.]|nr:hypothetical protein [Endomicrobium sp.]